MSDWDNQLKLEKELQDRRDAETPLGQPLYRQAQYDVYAHALLVCSLCLFKEKTKEENADNRLTIVDGQLVCVDHVSYVVAPYSRARWLRSGQERNAK